MAKYLVTEILVKRECYSANSLDPFTCEAKLYSGSSFKLDG